MTFFMSLYLLYNGLASLLKQRAFFIKMKSALKIFLVDLIIPETK